MTERPLILISNDDSIYAKGLKELVKAVKPLGEVVVVAPERPQSGKSHAVTLDMPLTYRQTKFDEEITSYKCNGTPADCIKIALFKILNRMPDIVLSGINHGSNSSVNILYSGTMGAATEGALHGIPSIGFSLLDFAADADFSTARIYVSKITEAVLNHKHLKNICLNVNIPYEQPENIKGIKICRQCVGEWKEFFTERFHPGNKRPYYWLTGSYINHEPENEETDEFALSKSYVSVQPVKIDCTDYQMITELKTWGLE